MPLVRIEIIKGHTAEYKMSVLQSVHEGLITALGIPDDDRNQRLYELDNELFERRVSKSDRFIMIELTFFPGRSKEMKRAAIREITDALGKAPGIPADDIYIVITEPPLENWGFGGQQASDIGMQYKKD